MLLLLRFAAQLLCYGTATALQLLRFASPAALCYLCCAAPLPLRYAGAHQYIPQLSNGDVEGAAKVCCLQLNQPGPFLKAYNSTTATRKLYYN